MVLSSTNLSDDVAPMMGDLPKLANLDISDSALMGEIPPLTKLEEILLNSNRLEGSILAYIGNLFAVQWLILYNN